MNQMKSSKKMAKLRMPKRSKKSKTKDPEPIRS